MTSANGLADDQVSSESKRISFDQETVAFPSCGVTLRGILLRPKNPEPTAAIVIAPGMSGVKEGSIMKFAEYFASTGMAVLAFDNINFGESDGEPRQEADPVLQRRGYRDAITFLSFREEIDKTRIGIFGTSYSGGHVLEVAAHDRRVKCVVAQIPAISGFEAIRRSVRPDQRPSFLGMLDQDREQRFRGGEPAIMKAVSNVPGELCMMPGDAAYEYFMGQARVAPRWRNEVTLRTLDLWRGIDNATYMPWISPTPLLLIVALGDELVPADLTLDAFARAREPKKLLTISGGHFSPYSEHFPRVSADASEWFARHLAIGGAKVFE